MSTAIPGAGLRRAVTAVALGAIAAAVLVATGGCSTASRAAAPGSGGARVIQVVAAENFWGSIASQLGGTHVKVASLISNPDTDPHAYEPTTADGRAVSVADYVISNGIGYDTWAGKLLSANPMPHRTALTVGTLLGRKAGDNPHQWYSADSVHQVVDRITADYQKMDPADAAYFDAQRQTFLNRTLAPYDQLETAIRTTYAGTPIGASESIVTPLAESLGLKLLTPASFLDAESEGSDPTAADKAAIDHQIAARQIKVYVFNTQNSDPDVMAQVSAAKAQGIPVAQVTETLAPANDSFQDWQVQQLQGIEHALEQATGK
ncbi:zinc ABC transporter substrate-binding protein [Kitasatospora sp. NBC_01250]|uniref:metal ABC transporter solute-binding protein, Zn/Mn family n=1 Tax=Kitasatospora sp. NBC_01250 TaxID=2903571 RepID=UPI002E3044DE|nr:zinc ABC transporter substrate-binding protein [Kitasatospora sp. NBC_01250]